MYKLGVIPAAGKGSRWGGYHKELLPCGSGRLLIDHTIEAMALGGADAFLVVASREKIGTLARHISQKHEGKQVYYAIQRGANDIWSAIVESFQIPADVYMFAMPDTLYSKSFFDFDMTSNFVLGLFTTEMPERFGTLRNRQIVNKEPGDDDSYMAWGTLVWSHECVQFWRAAQPENYTDAINRAIDKFGLHGIGMDFYHDMATYEDYHDYLLHSL